jgi:hypothetical protein
MTNFKGRNITQYLTFERLDVIGQMTLLVDAEISSLAKSTDGVGMCMWCHCQVQPLHNLY